MNKHSGAIEELYYKRAAEAEMETYVFDFSESLPKNREGKF